MKGKVIESQAIPFVKPFSLKTCWPNCRSFFLVINTQKILLGMGMSRDVWLSSFPLENGFSICDVFFGQNEGLKKRELQVVKRCNLEPSSPYTSNSPLKMTTWDFGKEMGHTR